MSRATRNRVICSFMFSGGVYESPRYVQTMMWAMLCGIFCRTRWYGYCDNVLLDY